MIVQLSKFRCVPLGTDPEARVSPSALVRLKAANLIGNPVKNWRRMGTDSTAELGKTEDLLSLAAGPFSSLLKSCTNPSAIVVHHSYGENASLGRESEDQDLMSRATYFPALLLRNLMWIMSRISVCLPALHRFLSLVTTGAGLLGATENPPVICLTADVRPNGMWFDARRKKT